MSLKKGLTMATARIARPYYRVHIICNRRYRPQCVFFCFICSILHLFVVHRFVVHVHVPVHFGCLLLLARLDDLHGNALGNGIRGDVRDQRLLLRRL